MRLNHNVPLRPVSMLTPNANRYCGPGAISIITGHPVEIATEAIRARRERFSNKSGPVTGTCHHEVVNALFELGYHPQSLGAHHWRDDIGEKPTLAAFLRWRRGDWLKWTFLIATTSHYVVARGRKIADNVTVEPVFLREFGRDVAAGHGRRARIVKVWRVSKNLDAVAYGRKQKRKRKLARSEKTDPGRA